MPENPPWGVHDLIFVSVIGALLILGLLSWRDLNERTRHRRAEGLPAEAEWFQPEPDSQEQLPQPAAHLTPDDAIGVRRLYVNAFWGGIVGNMLLFMIGLSVPLIATLTPLGTLLLFLLFLYASYRVLQLLGHDPLTSILLCLLILVPFFALIQYAALGHRCRLLFGPLGSVPGR